jgi:hypothetical protein
MDDRAALIEKYLGLVEKNGNTYVACPEFLAEYKLSSSDILRAGLDGFSGLVAAAGVHRPQNLGLPEEELLDDYLKVARQLGQAPSSVQYTAFGTHSRNAYTRRFGSWNAVHLIAAKHALRNGDQVLADILARSGGSKVAIPTRQDRPAKEQVARNVAPPTELIPEGMDRFTHESRKGVAMMSTHYSKLYCLERQMRTMVAETLRKGKGDSWWDNCVPQQVRENAKRNLENEERLGVTPRSDRLVDYTTLGELGVIVDSNWKEFASVFKNQEAMKRIMRDLNMLRAYVAHCTPLPQDEVTRLDLNISDWMRQLR